MSEHRILVAGSMPDGGEASRLGPDSLWDDGAGPAFLAAFDLEGQLLWGCQLFDDNGLIGEFPNMIELDGGDVIVGLDHGTVAETSEDGSIRRSREVALSRWPGDGGGQQWRVLLPDVDDDEASLSEAGARMGLAGRAGVSSCYSRACPARVIGDV